MHTSQDAPQTHSRPTPRADQVLMFDQRYRPVVVSGEAAAVREYKDFNPATNRWAAKDTLANLLYCCIRRPVATAGVMVFALLATHFALGATRGVILGLSGAATPVSYNQINPGDASQVGYWLVNNNLTHGATTTSKTMLVNWAASGQVPQATYVDNRQPQLNPGEQQILNTLGNTPILEVSNQR